MADIRIEEKKGSSIIPWIIGLLLLALLIWGAMELFGDDDDIDEVVTEEAITEEPVAPVTTSDYAPAIAAFMATTDDMEGEMGLDHEFSHRALTELADASVAIAQSKGVVDETNADSKADRVKQLADDITKDPMAGDHADKIKQAALLITEILEDVNTQADGGNATEAVTNLRVQAQALSSATLTLDQKEDVRAFFAQARTVLEQLG